MQILLSFKPEKPLIIPFNYTYCLQSALYAMLGEVGASDFFHDEGFGEGLKFKGFCFGPLQGKYNTDRENKKIIFEDNVYLEVRSPVFDFIDAFQRAIEEHPFIKLYDTRLNVTGAQLMNRHLSEGITAFNAVTPVVIKEKLEDGHTKYLSPEEEEYFIRICRNIETKYASINGSLPDEVLIRPDGELKKVVTKYKNIWITGYTGAFEINTSLRMAEFIYNTGFGEKNSQGFGFLKLKGER